MNTQYEYLPDDIDTAFKNFNNIVVNAADQSLKRSRVNLKKKSQKNSKKWYVPSLRQMKNEIKKLGRILCSKPYDQNVREKYHRALKCYKRQCKKEQRAYRANIINKMENLQTENPKVYWKLVEELSDKYKMGSKIEIEKLFSHYKNINTIMQTDVNAHLQDDINKLEQIKSFSPLDYIISEKEIKNAIKV